MQRAGTLRYMGPPRPGPLLNRPRGDKCSEQGRPSQANRGPKNLGRSVGFFVSAMGVALIFDGVIEALETHGITALH